MEMDLDGQIAEATNRFIAGRDPGQVLHSYFHATPPGRDPALEALAALLPHDQIAVSQVIDRLNLGSLPSVVILLAGLRKSRAAEEWIHFNLAKHLDAMLGAGVSEAKLPAIVHAQLAMQGLETIEPSVVPFLFGVISRGLAGFAPREAIRVGLQSARHGDSLVLLDLGSAFEVLGLATPSGRPTISELLALARTLQIAADDIPQTTSLDKSAGLTSVMVEPPRRINFPPVQGDREYYIFAQSGRPTTVPSITVHCFDHGIFSIDASRRGLEHHYVFDRNRNCVLELANGADPFIEQNVLEFDEPVAILDDQFSGAMNIFHFLLDHVTRIPLYERALATPCKFLIVDDHKYYRDIFERMGLSDRIIIPPSPRVSIRARPLLFSSNIAADFRHPGHLCSSWAVDYLRHGLQLEDVPATPGRRIMISRADAASRRILNWAEVLPIFQRHGFEIIELAGLTTDEQIAKFKDVEQIVGVHGAGLTNLLFAPADCAVLEILPPLVAVWGYWLLASARGQRYRALIAEDIEFPRPDYATWRHNPTYNERDLILPPDRLEAALIALANKDGGNTDAEPHATPHTNDAAPGISAASAFWHGLPATINTGPASPNPTPASQHRLPLVNIALGKLVMQSSDAGHRCPSKPYDRNAVSGIKTCGFGFHTNAEPDPWWMLDLGNVHDIRQIVVYNRESANPDNANTMSVSLSTARSGPWHEVHRCHGRFGGVLTGAPLIVKLNPPFAARCLRLQLHEPKAFHLDEVEVYSPVPADDPEIETIAALYDKILQLPGATPDAGDYLLNSESWNWAAFALEQPIDSTGDLPEWFGPKPRFELDPSVPFNGRVATLRVLPVGGTGNVFYSMVNSCLLARSMMVEVIEFPQIDGMEDYLPLTEDNIRLEPAGLCQTKRPVMEASFYWPKGFEAIVGSYSYGLLIDTIDRFVKPAFGTFLRDAGDAGRHRLQDDILAIHFRGGDIFEPGGTHLWYVQPPASFYIEAIQYARSKLGVSGIHIVFQDRTNPCVDIVSNYLATIGMPYTEQSASVFEDMSTLMSARHLVAAYGTFCEATALLSERLKTYIGFRHIVTQRRIEFWSQSRFEEILQAKGVRTLVIDDTDQSYIPPETWVNSPEQIDLMRNFPQTKLRMFERLFGVERDL